MLKTMLNTLPKPKYYKFYLNYLSKINFKFEKIAPIDM